MLAGLLLFGAEAVGTTFSVTYAAGPDCPTQATFEAAILARSPTARKVETGAGEGAQVRFEVTLDTAQGPRRMRVVLADGTVSEREIADDGCTESMQSMAVIAAMTLDAQRRDSTPNPVPAAAEPSSAPEPKPEPPPPALPTRSPLPSPPAPAPRTWLALSATATSEGAAAPTPAFGAALGVELGSQPSGLLAPSMRLSAVWARAAVVETSIGNARFQVALARVLLCGLRAGADQANVRLCGLVDGGALLAAGINARNQRSQNMPWLSLGAGLVGTLRLAGPLSLELGAGARGMVVHDSFIFAPGQSVHQVPVFAWNFWMGPVYRAW